MMRQYHSGCTDRTGEGASARFVHTADGNDSFTVQLIFNEPHILFTHYHYPPVPPE